MALPSKAKSTAHGSGRHVRYYYGPGDLINHGGPNQGSPAIVLVFWGFNAPGADPSGEAPYLTNFLGAIGGSPWLNVVTQYTGGRNGGNILAATIYDNSAVPAAPSQGDIENTVRRNAWYYGGGTNLQYMVATPHNHNTPGFNTQWCAFHSYTNNNPGKFGLLYYTDMPYNTDGNCWAWSDGNLLDGVSHVAGHEVGETITDPHWYDGWVDAGNQEIGDKCYDQHQRVDLNGRQYSVQPLYSNLHHDCIYGYTPPPPCSADGYGYCAYFLGGYNTPTSTCWDGTQLYDLQEYYEVYRGSTDLGQYTKDSQTDCNGQTNVTWSPGEPSQVYGDPNLP